MTQEEKQLLLKDLCTRLSYGVKVHIDNDGFYDKREPYDTILTIQSSQFLIDLNRETGPDAIIIKPYLRPLSSMTEEETKEFDVITNGEKGFYEDEDGWIRCDNVHTKWGVWPKGCAEMLDWLNKRHFDYRGLIPMGLALEAKEGMYGKI